jgi:hypothetical protein
MSFRGLLVIIALIGAFFYFSEKPKTWWRSMTHAAESQRELPSVSE